MTTMQCYYVQLCLSELTAKIKILYEDSTTHAGCDVAVAEQQFGLFKILRIIYY